MSGWRNTGLGRVDDWLLAPAPPERLAVLRVLIGTYALIYVAVSFGEFARLDGRSAGQFEPVGIAGLLDGPVSSTALWTLYAALVISGIGFVMGKHFRLAGPVFSVGFLAWASYHASWGQMLHFEHVVSLHLLLLGVAPAADALSADARRRERSPTDRGSVDVRYGWPVRLLAIVTVVTYAIAGVAKLRVGGWAWVDGSTLANHIAYSTTRLDLLGEPRPPLAAFVVSQEWMSRPLAMASIGVELLAPLALLGGWARRLWVPVVVLFHLGTLTTLFVFFPYNGLGFALLPLYRVEVLAERFHRRRPLLATRRAAPTSVPPGSVAS